MKISKQTLTALSMLAVWLMLSWVIGSRLLHLKSPQLWYLRGGLAAIGLIGFIAYLLMTRSSRRSAPAAPGANNVLEDLDFVFAEAANRLRASNRTKSKSVAGLPAIFVLGDSNTAKTSVLANSGLEAELLAGQAFQNNLVTPTKVVNLWFSRDIIFVDPAGKVIADGAARRKLFHKFAPVGFGSVVGGSAPPPRAVVIAFDCESLLAPGGTEAVSGKARQLQAALAELAQELGTSFPVYVLFTKADRLPYFREYVDRLTEAEVSEVFGATLPLEATRPGVYAEQQSQRLTEAFQSLYYSLAEKRTVLLAREHDSAKLPNIYEFPREFGKLRPLVVQFLLDLCRPSQLQTTPFLRGFYFTGVRPVLLRDLVPAAAPQIEPEPAGFDASATRIFSRRAAAVPLADAPQGGSRKVPQWIFLSHLFSGLILGDRAALGLTQKNVKVSFWRRALVATAALLALVLAGLWTWSYSENQSLIKDAEAAAATTPAQQLSAAQLPSLDALQHLEAVRQSLATLDGYQRDGAPWRLRFGLYSGSKLREPQQRIYYNLFRRLLLAPTQETLIAISSNPPQSQDISGYRSIYNALKAYLITTRNHEKSSREFLSPVLLQHWENNRQIDNDRVKLAQKQFDFYAGGLAESNPYPTHANADEKAVSTARAYLNRFKYGAGVYQVMLTEASKQNPPVVFNQVFPGSSNVIVNKYPVEGAFSKQGFALFQKELNDIDRYPAGEAWVLGPKATAPQDKTELAAEIDRFYTDDFIKAWRTYLGATRFVGYRDVPDAANKLAQMTGNQSPILAVLCLASDNTAVAQKTIADLFKPVQIVTPKGCLDRLQSPANAAYLTSLTALQTSVNRVALNISDEAAKSQTMTDVAQAQGATSQIVQTFGTSDYGGVARKTEEILLAPVKGIPPIIGSIGKEEANRGAKQACDALQPILAKYPFNPHSKVDATIKEVTDMLKQPDGTLWSTYNATFQKLMVKDGSTYRPAPGASLTLSSAFLGWVNHAAAISDALFKNGSQSPSFTFAIRPVPSDDIESVTLEINGQRHKYAKGEGNFQFTWPGAVQDVRLIPTFVGGSPFSFPEFDGTWSVLRWLDNGEHLQHQGESYSFDWVLRTTAGVVKIPSNGHTATVSFVLDPMGSPIRPGFFNGLTPCARLAVP